MVGVHRLATAALLVILLSAGCLGEPEPLPPGQERLPPEPFTFAGTGCTEVALFAPADADAVRGFVPSQVALVGEATGRAVLAIYAFSCETYGVGGGASAPGGQSEVGVQIEAPDGTSGPHFYSLWHLTTDPEMRLRMAGFELLGDLAPELAVTLTATSPLSAGVTATVPWGNSSYNLSATSAGPGDTPTEAAAHWWHLSPDGLVHVRYENALDRLEPALGEVTTAEHAALGHMLGAGAVSAPGVVTGFSFTASAAFHDAPPS